MAHCLSQQKRYEPLRSVRHSQPWASPSLSCALWGGCRGHSIADGRVEAVTSTHKRIRPVEGRLDRAPHHLTTSPPHDAGARPYNSPVLTDSSWPRPLLALPRTKSTHPRLRLRLRVETLCDGERHSRRRHARDGQTDSFNRPFLPLEVHSGGHCRAQTGTFGDAREGLGPGGCVANLQPGPPWSHQPSTPAGTPLPPWTGLRRALRSAYAVPAIFAPHDRLEAPWTNALFSQTAHRLRLVPASRRSESDQKQQRGSQGS